MDDNRRLRRARGFRLTARIIGIFVAVFFLAMLIGEGVASMREEGFRGITTESLYALVPLLLAVAAFIVAWWRERVGGILLIVAYMVLSLAPSVHSIYFGKGFQFYAGMWFFALPFLVAGIFFIIAHQQSRQSS